MTLKLLPQNDTQPIAIALRTKRNSSTPTQSRAHKAGGSASKTARDPDDHTVREIVVVDDTTVREFAVEETGRNAQARRTVIQELFLGFASKVPQFPTQIGNQPIFLDIHLPADKKTYQKMMDDKWLSTTDGKRFAADSIACFIVQVKIEVKARSGGAGAAKLTSAKKPVTGKKRKT